MSTPFTQQDVSLCFQLAAENRDVDEFLTRLSTSELDAQNDNGSPGVVAENVARRVLDVLGVLTHKPIPESEKVAGHIAGNVLDDPGLQKFYFADAVRETAKQAWDYGLAELQLQPDTTLAKIVQDRPKFKFG